MRLDMAGCHAGHAKPAAREGPCSGVAFACAWPLLEMFPALTSVPYALVPGVRAPGAASGAWSRGLGAVVEHSPSCRRWTGPKRSLPAAWEPAQRLRTKTLYSAMATGHDPTTAAGGRACAHAADCIPVIVQAPISVMALPVTSYVDHAACRCGRQASPAPRRP